MDREEKLIKEYEMCQDDNRDQSRSYWIIFGLFMSASTATLGWIIPNIPDITNSITEKVGWRVTATIFALAIIIIIIFLKRWLDRAIFLVHTNYGRMHQIELKLGMSKSLRIYFIDRWHEARKKAGIKSERLSKEEIKKLSELVLREISEELSSDDYNKLYKNKKIFIDYCLRTHPKYTPRASTIADKIIYTLITLWGILIVYVWSTPFIYPCLIPLIKNLLEGASS